MKTKFFLITTILIFFTFIFAAAPANQGNQNAGQNNNKANQNNAGNQNAQNNKQNTAKKQQGPALTRGYRGIKLGMKLDNVRKILKKDRLLEIDIRTDFGDLDEEPYHILKARNVPYITSVYYQFGTTKSIKQQLFAIIIHFNKEYNDFFRLFEKMKKKYGKPNMFTPNMATWHNKTTKIILNSPATVKYIDIQLYRTMQREYSYMRHRYFPPTDEAANKELTDDL